MNEPAVIPELKEIIGAVLFAAREPMTVANILRVLKDTAETYGGVTSDFSSAGKEDVEAAVAALREELDHLSTGYGVCEVAHGYRLENDARCGPWVRVLLKKGKPYRLSRPALETLAIIAYRQPCTRSEMESVRGVAVDQIVRNLLEMQLVKITGRSELPGRPWLFGTTRKFLEYFGMNSLGDLPGVDELKRLETMKLESEAEEVRQGEFSETLPEVGEEGDE